MNQMKWAFALILSVGMSLMGGGTYAVRAICAQFS